jgi:hypothetical protein
MCEGELPALLQRGSKCEEDRCEEGEECRHGL